MADLMRRTMQNNIRGERPINPIGAWKPLHGKPTSTTIPTTGMKRAVAGLAGWSITAHIPCAGYGAGVKCERRFHHLSTYL